MLVAHLDGALWMIAAPDGKTLYYSAYLGRVRRQTIANFGARPRPGLRRAQ
jgi:hypothetical protein